MHFNYDKLEDKPREGSAERYEKRIMVFERDSKVRHPRLLHHTLWMLHNCIAHPILAAAPNAYGVELHALTSQWLNHTKTYKKGASMNARVLSYNIPSAKNKGWWLIHNTVAHIAIGLAPCDATFKFHDWSANKMGEPDWV